jgi:hypothetical protein
MSEGRLGWYVYCVIRGTERPSLKGVAGVDAAHPIELLAHGDLAAVVSRVRLEEFGSEPLKRNLEDLAWLEPVALAHNAVLAHMRTCDAVVPFRTFTIFGERSRALEMLEHERTYLRDALERLQRRDEWSVKMLADLESLAAIARGRHRAPATSGAPADQPDTPGRAFFARKKFDRSISEEASAIAETVARQAHERLREHAAATRLLPRQNPRISGRAGEMVLNGAYLVDRSAVAEFANAIEQVRQGECPNGIELIVSGPFAPYNFVSAPEGT